MALVLCPIATKKVKHRDHNPPVALPDVSLRDKVLGIVEMDLVTTKGS